MAVFRLGLLFVKCFRVVGVVVEELRNAVYLFRCLCFGSAG